jgi:hypothetical protein
VRGPKITWSGSDENASTGSLTDITRTHTSGNKAMIVHRSSVPAVARVTPIGVGIARDLPLATGPIARPGFEAGKEASGVELVTRAS